MNIEEKYEKLALEVLNHSKNILLVNLRFLGYAFDQLKLVCKGKSIAVDGKNIYFNPLWVLGKYKEERMKNVMKNMNMWCMINFYQKITNLGGLLSI